MERLQGYRWNRCAYALLAILASNLMTFMFSTNFYSNSLIRTPVSLERNVTDQIQIYNKCCSSSPTQGDNSGRCDYIKRMHMQPQRFEANDPSQGRLMVQQSLTHSLQTVYQLTKPASEDTAEGGDINGEILVPNPFPSDVLDDRLQNDRESLTEVPSDMVKDDFSTFGDDINGRADCLQCPQCNETIITQVVHVRQKPESTNTDCSQNAEQITNHYTSPQNQNGSDNEMKTIFIITPTYHRNTQKIDLNSMCHTLTLVPQVVWIIIEDAPRPTNLVTQLLKRCRVKTVHLTAHTSPAYRVRKGAAAKSKPRGVEQRNAGLRWLRDHYTAESCNGVLYFGDDDNKYDLRLFEDIRHTRQASVWKVAWAGGLRWEGPTCHNGHAKSWHSGFSANKRALPIDMAAFAVDLCELIKRPKARVGVNIHGRQSKLGYLETDFLQHFTSRSKVECRGSEKEAYVWHSHTSSPSLHFERRARSSKAVET